MPARKKPLLMSLGELDGYCIELIMHHLMRSRMSAGVTYACSVVEGGIPEPEPAQPAPSIPRVDNPCPTCGYLNPEVVRDGGSFGCRNCGQIYHRCVAGTVGPQHYELGGPGPMFCQDCTTSKREHAASEGPDPIADCMRERDRVDRIRAERGREKLLTFPCGGNKRKRSFVDVLTLGLTCRRFHDIAVGFLLTTTPECAMAECSTAAMVLSSLVGPWYPRVFEQIDPNGVLELCLSKSNKGLKRRRHTKKHAAKALVLSQVPRIGQESPLQMLNHWLLLEIINHI